LNIRYIAKSWIIFQLFCFATDYRKEENKLEQMRVYIVNLRKYNEGELVDLWFTPPIEEINRLCRMAEELEGTSIGEVASELQHAFFNSFEEMLEHLDDIICYPDCDSMSDVAYYLVVEVDDFGEVSEYLKTYIDYEACGRDLEVGGNYLVTSRGVFEYAL
jgi:antirestriction protein